MSFTLERDAWGRLVLVNGDGRHVGVEPVRAFPITGPREGLSLVDRDGRELAWVRHPDELPAAARALVEEELRAREFVPLIVGVRSVSGTVEPTTWEVDTDRGPTRFVLNSEDDVRRLGENRAVVVDAHGVRYLIADIAALDPGSRRRVERYL